ncbi:hypothetical protein F4819DRAFT_117215 [Hypoxylon fuscum]|nr:hypothetical protein F4819DRAFT_117215 [Hypoxylon fuscum]
MSSRATTHSWSAWPWWRCDPAAHPHNVRIPFMMVSKAAENRSFFAPFELIKADDLTLESFVLAHGWSNLNSARSRPLPQGQRAGLHPRRVHSRAPNLEWRVVFSNSQPGLADCAFQKLADPRNATDLANIRRRGTGCACAPTGR